MLNVHLGATLWPTQQKHKFKHSLQVPDSCQTSSEGNFTQWRRCLDTNFFLFFFPLSSWQLSKEKEKEGEMARDVEGWEKTEGGKSGAETQREHPSFNQWGVIAWRQSLSKCLKKHIWRCISASLTPLAANRGLLAGICACLCVYVYFFVAPSKFP